TIEELRTRQKSSALSLRIRDPKSAAEAAISAVSGVSVLSATADEAAPERRTLRVSFDAALDTEAVTEALVRALTSKDIGVHALVPEKASLEQVFSELTRHEQEASTPVAKVETP
ncbi:MAG TPA: hypothetical protein VGF76_25585, partial [Polyangiaceae bacterium]